MIGFDGLGHGAARRKAGLPLDYHWEKPVGSVLDHFGLEDVTLIGLSMGGYFALRAAAFEPRVKRVITSGHAFDYRKVARPPATAILEFFHDHLREFTNRLSAWKIRKGGMEAWNISHLMYVLAVDEPMAALEFAHELNEENLHSDMVRQDVLLLASRNDHFIRTDDAQNHCQIGNIGLALQVMTEWIGAKTIGTIPAGWWRVRALSRGQAANTVESLPGQSLHVHDPSWRIAPARATLSGFAHAKSAINSREAVCTARRRDGHHATGTADPRVSVPARQRVAGVVPAPRSARHPRYPHAVP